MHWRPNNSNMIYICVIKRPNTTSCYQNWKRILQIFLASFWSKKWFQIWKMFSDYHVFSDLVTFSSKFLLCHEVDSKPRRLYWSDLGICALSPGLSKVANSFRATKGCLFAHQYIKCVFRIEILFIVNFQRVQRCQKNFSPQKPSKIEVF